MSIHRAFRLFMGLNSVAFFLLLTACGGGSPEPAQAAQAATETEQTAKIQATRAASDLVSQPLSALQILGDAAGIKGLRDASATPSVTLTGIGATQQCLIGYKFPTERLKSAVVPLPATGGIFYAPSDLVAWRRHIDDGPFLRDGDYARGSPGDWRRITDRARAMISSGETPIKANGEAIAFGSAGTLARDAAFYQLFVDDAGVRAAVRSYLLAQTTNPAVDFQATLCLKDRAGWVPDGYFYQASWFLRFVITYDFMRAQLAVADRALIEAFIRRNAYFLAALADNGLADPFPNRMRGDYNTRRDVAAPANDAAKWLSKRYDTNGDCVVNADDRAEALPVYAYVTQDLVIGPRLSILSQYYNNRRSVSAFAYGAAGLILADAALIGSAKRYFMEWLTYSVYPDGSQGEFARNGDYCIAGQGTVYGASNLQGAALFAGLLMRQGDRSLLSFSTTDGLFGSQSATGQPAKSIARAISSQFDLLTGKTRWFFHEPWRTAQNLTAGNALAPVEVHYMGSSKATDDFHELGLLSTAKLFPELPVASVIMRDAAMIDRRFPGSTGNPVATGYGEWTDAFNALPSAFLMRP